MFKQDNIVLQNTSATQKNDGILSIIKKAGYQKLTPVQKKVIPPILEGKDIAVETEGTRGKTAAFILPLLQLIDTKSAGIKAVVITPDFPTVKKVERQFRLFTGRFSSPLKITSVGYEKNIKKELSQVQKNFDILVGTSDRIIDHLRRDHLSIAAVQSAVVFQDSQLMGSEFTKDIQYIFSKITGKPQVILLSPHIREEEISVIFSRKPLMMLQETNQMSLNDEDVKKAIESILAKIKEDEDPDELNTYKKFVRRHVPFTMKSYFAAYLFKNSLDPRSVNGEAPATLFVSIGKNRRVFPRDLSQLFLSALKIDQSRIGGIKVLDNYSFIEVPASVADRAITLLDGSEFRGRKITVNHARKKEN